MKVVQGKYAEEEVHYEQIHASMEGLYHKPYGRANLQCVQWLIDSDTFTIGP